MIHSGIGNVASRILTLLACVTVAVAVAWALPLAAQTPPAAEDTATAPPAEAPAAEEAPAEEPPSYPEELTSLTMDLEEFELRLLPLTADQLTALAETWQGIVQEQTSAVVEATIASRTGGKEATEADINSIVELNDVRGNGFDRYSAVIDALEKKGGDEATVASLRNYRSAILVEETQRADWQALLRMAANWTTSEDGGLRIAKNVAIIGAAFLALLIVARFVRSYARRLFGKIPDLSKLLQAFLAMVVYWVTVAIGLMIVLSALGVDISPLFAVVGGASFIIAFAMQDTLGNLAAGLMIMINRPFDEGDYITAGGTSGTVKSVSVVSTTVTTPDNQVIVIPNSKVWGDVITNTTASDIRRVDMQFGIGYEDSIEKAQQVLEEVVTSHPAVLKDPAPVIRVGALADSSVNFIVRPWTKSADYWSVLWDLNRSVKEAFDANGISIPFPQTDMHIKMPAGAAAAPMLASGGSGSSAEAPVDYATGDDGAKDDET
ncbi:mechanosensitive ion channel family protein [Tropicimonas aquimaris]|uniref:Small-conductance mechanosensitive channel n=1 Tax=Tropicimonas aquimaris TaxID=914152 RepID=A0ABW3IRN9_9RHOB